MTLGSELVAREAGRESIDSIDGVVHPFIRKASELVARGVVVLHVDFAVPGSSHRYNLL